MAKRDNWWRRAGSRRSGFRYVTAEGERIADETQLARIKALVVPPAWHDVRICPHPGGRIQAMGLDDLGRRQYIYHPAFVEKRQRVKYERVERFGRALPELRKVANEHMNLPLPNRDKVLAVVIRLINDLYFRVGSEAYTKRYRTYGITTLRNRHLKIEPKGCLVFQFVGKHHLRHRRILTDAELAKTIQEIQSLPGSRLFQYIGDDGSLRPVRPKDVNDYIRAAMGDGFSAKDFRIWAGTVLAASELAELGPATSEIVTKRNVADALKRVAKRLGNTPKICRSSYVHPAVIDSYLKGLTLKEFNPRKSRIISRMARDYEPEEAALLELLSNVSDL